MQFEPTPEQAKAAANLKAAIRLQDAELAEVAFYSALQNIHPLHVELLILLLEAPWHCRHEDLVQAFQRLRIPASVDALERTAHRTYSYLDYDECFGLARKCTWALADIGTPEAHQALTRLAASENQLIAGYAQKRLTNWQKELHRKGFQCTKPGLSEGLNASHGLGTEILGSFTDRNRPGPADPPRE